MRIIVSRFAMPGGWAHNGVGVFINIARLSAKDTNAS